MNRPRVLVLNQYYWPGVESTGFLLSELCGALAEEFDITVVTGKPRVGVNARRVVHDGVTVIRVPSTTFRRANIWLRAINYATYLVGSALAGLRQRRPDVVLAMTDPPVIADVALLVARRFHVPLVVISQDVFPEIAVELDRLENPLVVACLRRAVRFYLERADHVVAIGETMKARLEEKGAPVDRLEVIPNWVDTNALTPQPRNNEWSTANRLNDCFVVMHSSNVGHAQDLDTLVRAAALLRDVDRLAIVVVGDGARRDEIATLAAELGVNDIVRFLPYQERDVLPLSLSAADVHVVGLAAGLSGYVVPSRLYGILAVGRPVIVAADADSETAQLVAGVGCGVVMSPGRPERLADVIRAGHGGELDLAAMGAAGRQYVVANADRDVAAARYRALLRRVVAVHPS
jgi:glycosyltransferase involved in cell wall biosynthesis